MARFTLMLLALLALGLLAGCGAAASSSDSTGSQPSAATTATTAAASAEPSLAASPALDETTQPSPDAPTTGGKDQSQSLDLLASLTRSGGLQGRTQTLLVQQDGALALLNGEPGSAVFKTGQASAAQLQALQTLLNSADWRQLDESYGRQVPDGFMYSVTGGGQRITTYDGAQNPPALENALSQLNELWQTVQSAP